MLNILKTEITGFDSGPNAEVFGYNANYRSTMGYDATTKTINVKVEKIIRPDLTRDENVEVSYETVDEKTYTSSDFIKTSDNNIWVIDFDVTTERILSPLDAWEYASQFKTDSYTHTKVLRIVKERYNANHNPLFVLFDFYKETADFETATVVFYTKHNEEAAEHNNTIITNTNAQLVDTKQLLNLAISAQTHVFYELLDEENNVIDVEINPILEGLNSGFEKVRGDYFVASVPKNSQYKLRVNYTRSISDKDVSNRFDVRCINALSSKDRITTGLKSKTTPDYSHLGTGYQEHLNAKFAGYDIITLSNSLDIGDNIKFKLDCGKQLAYSELELIIV